MEIKVNVNAFEKDNMLGYARVTFDDKYVLENIKIKQNSQGYRYVELPKYSTVKKDENGNRIMKDDIRGGYEYEYKDIFHPYTEEASKAFTDAILTEYKNVHDNGANKNGTAYTIGNDSFSVGRVTVGLVKNYNEKNHTLGLANVSFNDMFIVENVKIKKSVSEEHKGENIIDMPTYRAVAKDEETKKPILDENGKTTYEYKDAFHAITSEGYHELYDNIMAEYNNKVAARGQAQMSNVAQNNVVAEQDNTSITQEGIPLFDDYDEPSESNGRR